MQLQNVSLTKKLKFGEPKQHTMQVVVIVLLLAFVFILFLFSKNKVTHSQKNKFWYNSNIITNKNFIIFIKYFVVIKNFILFNLNHKRIMRTFIMTFFTIMNICFMICAISAIINTLFNI